MRKTFLAVLAALVAVLGIATAAVAAVSAPSPTVVKAALVSPAAVTCIAPLVVSLDGLSCVTQVITPSASATPAPTPVPVPVCGPFEHYNSALGRCLRDDFRDPIYNSCDEYRSHNIYSIRRDDPRYRDIFDPRRSGVACEPTTTTTVNGACTTVTTDYTNSINRWNDIAYRYRANSGTLTEAQRAELDRAYLDRLRYESLYNRARSNTSTNTTCTTPPVTVQVAPAPVIYTSPPSSQVSRYPVGSINTGDGSVAVIPLGR